MLYFEIRSETKIWFSAGLGPVSSTRSVFCKKELESLKNGGRLHKLFIVDLFVNEFLAAFFEFFGRSPVYQFLDFFGVEKDLIGLGDSI